MSENRAPTEPLPPSASGDVVRRYGSGIDDAWDGFVAAAPGGHHVQTSRWAAVKAETGWDAIRLVVEREGRIVAGCQILKRRVRGLGSIAYIPRGPLGPAGETGWARAVLDAIAGLAEDDKIVFLKLQPASHDLTSMLERRGFRLSDLEVSPSATIRVAVRREEDQLLGAMRASTRSNIRKADRKGVSVRAGGEDDLDAFGELVRATASRQGFPPYSSDYYRAIWRAFAPGSQARLVLAELEGEPLCALLLIGHGDTVSYKIGGWSGSQASIHPNELAHWAGIRWARASGYRWYDLEGVNSTMADALKRGEPLPDSDGRGVAHFKLGFGGELTFFPGTYDYAYRPLIAAALRAGGGGARWMSVAQRLLRRRG